MINIIFIPFIFPPGFHRRDDDQVHAVRYEHLHRQPGHGRHAGNNLGLQNF